MDCILQQINNSVCVFHRYNHSILNIKKICANLYKHNILHALYIILFYYSHQTKEESCYLTRYTQSVLISSTGILFMCILRLYNVMQSICSTAML